VIQWDYYLLRVKSMLGVKVLQGDDELIVREAWDCGLSPELAADTLKLEWMGDTTAAQEV
jgi:hypothetical protein